jgi:hypothetical protein
MTTVTLSRLSQSSRATRLSHKARRAQTPNDSFMSRPCCDSQAMRVVCARRDRRDRTSTQATLPTPIDEVVAALASLGLPSTPARPIRTRVDPHQRQQTRCSRVLRHIGGASHVVLRAVTARVGRVDQSTGPISGIESMTTALLMSQRHRNAPRAGDVGMFSNISDATCIPMLDSHGFSAIGLGCLTCDAVFRSGLRQRVGAESFQEKFLQDRAFRPTTPNREGR